MERARIGLIGCGRIAQRVHLHALRGLTGGALVAIAEPDEACRREAAGLAPDVALYDDHRDLLASAVDAVVVCTPPATHAALAMDALAAGKHVYVEKPLAHRLADAQRLVAAAEASDRIAAVGLNFRLHPLIADARRRLNAGEIGRPTAVRTVFTTKARALPEWKLRRESGGGALLDLFSHHADLVPYLLDQRVEVVAAQVRSVRSEDDTATVTLRAADGTLVQTLVSMAGIETDRIELIGDAGSLVFDRHWRRSLVRLEAARPGSALARLRGAIAGLGAAAAVFSDGVRPPVEDSFRLALEAWLSAIAEGTRPPVPLRAGLESLRLVEEAERLARGGAAARADAATREAVPA